VRGQVNPGQTGSAAGRRTGSSRIGERLLPAKTKAVPGAEPAYIHGKPGYGKASHYTKKAGAL